MNRNASVASGFLTGDLQDLYRHSPRNFSQTQAPPPIDRARLAGALEKYHRALGLWTPGVSKSLERLRHPASRVVIAGQQAGLLGGPALTVHKAVDAVLLARQLSTEDRPVIPVFWVASQDHDTQEIAQTTLMDSEERFFDLSLPFAAEHPVGRILHQKQWVTRILSALEDFQAPQAFKRQVFDWILESHSGIDRYVDGFVRLIASQLSALELLYVDPLHPELVTLFDEALLDELEDPLTGPRHIEEAAQILVQRGYKPQLRRPKGSTNLFLEGQDGRRRLLKYEAKTFYADRSYTQQQLRQTLVERPGCLTPAAGLRPILQDKVFPTLAVVLGPGETGYFAQLKDVYPLHGLEQPVIWPRLTVTWLEPPVVRMLQKYGFTAHAFQSNPNGVFERTLMEQSGWEDRFDRHQRNLADLLCEMTEDVNCFDVSLLRPLERARKHSEETLRRLERSITQSLMRKDADAQIHFSRLKRHLLPHGVPQERQINFLSFTLKHGTVPLERLLQQHPGQSLEMAL
ncbi:MAG: bacillithiol biosynthesis cysteine-adding enzyme BshC [Deinococcaceae bacterium]